MLHLRRLMLIVFMGCFPGCGETAPNAVKLDDVPEFLRPLAAATKVTLYSIDGSDKRGIKERPKAAEEFYGYPVLGKIEIKGAELRKEIVQALKQGTQNLNHGFARCFWPRHAFRVEKDGKSTDYVICFECSWIKVFIGEEVKDVVTNSVPQELLNRHLKEAGIPIAP